MRKGNATAVSHGDQRVVCNVFENQRCCNACIYQRLIEPADMQTQLTIKMASQVIIVRMNQRYALRRHEKKCQAQHESAG
jgi:hypothetical protein